MISQPDSAADKPPGRRLPLPERLPHLEGRRGTIVRVLYLVVALATLVVISGSFWFNARDYFGNMPAAAAYGFRTVTEPEGPVIAGVSSSEGIASGLRRGDRFLAIDGEPLAADANEFTIGDRLASDSDGRVTLAMRSGDGRTSTHVLNRRPVTSATREPVTGMPLWLFIAIGFTGTQLPLLAWSAASILLAIRRPRDPEAMLLAFAALLVCVPPAGFWLSALLGIGQPVRELIGNLGACMLLAAITGFPDGRFPNLAARITALLIVLLACALLLDAAGIRLPLGMGFLACNLAILVSVRLRFRGGGAQIERQQMKWAVFGFVAALALLLPLQVATQAGLLGDEGLMPFLADYVVINLGLLLIPAGLLVSLLRYRLYDAEAAISRSAGYAILTLLVGATFAASAEALEYFFENSLGQQGSALPGAIAAALAVVLITPLNQRIQNWAERRFQKGLLHLRRDLPECVGDMRETSGREPLLAEALERMSSAVRASHSAVLLGGEAVAVREIAKEAAEAWAGQAGLDAAIETLDCDRSDALFPMRIPLRIRHGAREPIGWVLLGPRPDGSFYGKDEREALAEVADPLARALQVVMLREEREAVQERRLKAIEEKLARALRALAGPNARAAI